MLEWMHWTVPSAIGFGALFSMLGILAVVDKRSPSVPRKGFLPMETTRGDRVFISMVTMFLIVLASLRFFPNSPLWGALVVSAVVMTLLFRWG